MKFELILLIKFLFLCSLCDGQNEIRMDLFSLNFDSYYLYNFGENEVIRFGERSEIRKKRNEQLFKEFSETVELAKTDSGKI